MTAQTPKPIAEMTRDEAIMSWNEAKATLDAAKAREMELRKHIVGSQFDVTKVGTQNIELGNGWKLKAVVKESYNLSSDTDKVDAVLDTFEDWQAERLVKWSARLSVKEYKELDDEDKAKLDGILTISASSPTLELIAPKG
ncbi:hypothetical protein [Paracoccus phage vB_PmaS-R3]|uniref:Uncharacterized protein n=1 Tax=Paracoccus phage vB_PmaS-R3 TaxID=2494563 RepID=A0A0B5A5Y7_9CAUD|nr:hypothetical protein VC48_gp11 [Paracoccus phage vB_PmaS-R3]AJD83135.1 hypothetical protein [Paracoccus phage vB_PmaS-R3]